MRYKNLFKEIIHYNRELYLIHTRVSMPNCHCGTFAIYNYNGEKTGIRCKNHIEKGMIDVYNKKCKHDGCMKQPVFNIIGQGVALYCKTHKSPNMINIKDKPCIADGCLKQPMFNIPGMKVGRYCKEHKLDGMVDVKNKHCGVDGCLTRPSYKLIGTLRAIRCVLHKTLDMIPINIQCEIDGCSKQPMFNTPGMKKGRFCKDHKLDGMIDVKNKKCQVVGCNTRPIYGIKNTKSALACSTHKLSNMVNIRHQTCEADNCINRASYNIPGEKKVKFCYSHKKDNMINIAKFVKCEVHTCEERAYYNTSSHNTPRFCSSHKDSDMINVGVRYCTTDMCKSIAAYGMLAGSLTKCSKHKERGMLKNPNTKCSQTNCKSLGVYEANRIRFCEDHKPSHAQNLGLEPCTGCGLEDILRNGKCSTCDPSIANLYQHAKENRIRDVLQAAGYAFVQDKMLETPQCGRERPDFQMDCGTHCVYLEVDEHQHQSYACECEQTRMINLVEVRGMPVHWIRYNPDSYQPLKGQKMVTQSQREAKLLEYVRYATTHTPQEAGYISDVIYLFYDEYDMTHQEWMKLI